MSKFNLRIKRFLEKQEDFKEVHIKGEVSGVFYHESGHIYFSLKDRNSLVECVVYRWSKRNIAFEIRDGMELLVIAKVIFYKPKGKFELDVRQAIEDGVGKLYVKFQQLKEKFIKEGLFDYEHKKAIPDFPKGIGIITSRDGDAIHDILKTVNDIWPFCEVILFPSGVQGSIATNQLINQVKLADSYDLDVLIITRGGGSIEDLWCFNEEALVRTIFDCRTPVITAIGHEKDNTLCDYVSDEIASTPTKAAIIAINNKDKVINQVSSYNVRLLTFMSSKITEYKNQFSYMLSKALFNDSTYVYGNKLNDFENLCRRFEYCSCELVNSRKNMLKKIKSEYVIRHPCRMQLDSSSLKLNELQSRLLDALNSIIKTKRHNLDNATDEFRFLSDKFLSTQSFRLNNVKTYYAIQNPCRIQLDNAYSDFSVLKDNVYIFAVHKLQSSQKDFGNALNSSIFKNPKLICEGKSEKLNMITSQFLNRSNEIILRDNHLLDLVKKSPALRNPYLICESKIDELDKIKQNNLIRNPFSMLDKHKQRLNECRQKLDKINQYIELKQAQEKQKSTYRKIIVAIVVIAIIILIIVFNGGI